MAEALTRSIEGRRLAEFSRAVRESSLKRLRDVPEGSENWRIRPDAMSIADLAQHLINADRWLLQKLRTKTLAPIVGQPGLCRIQHREEYIDLLEEFEQLGHDRARLLEGLSDSEFAEMSFDGRFGQEVSAWWIIVRGNLDHEIHHRGQIGVFLACIRAEGAR